MAELKAKTRSKLPAKTFGLPGSRRYPMPDKAHAANAKARATQMVNAGKLSPSSAAQIRAKANKVLGKGKGNGPKRRPVAGNLQQMMQNG